MTRSELRQLGRFLSSFAILLLIIVAAPLVLLAASARRFDSPNPLAGVPGPTRWELGTITDAMGHPLADDLVVDVIVRGCLLVMWVSVVLVAVTTALEIVHLVRHRGLSLPAVRGLGWAQGIARFVAAGLLVLVPLVTPRVTLASVHPDQPLSLDASDAAEPGVAGRPAHDTRLVTAEAPRWGRQSTRADPLAPSPRAGVHVVERGESIYAIAESIAADSPFSTAEVADAILDENLGREMPGGQRFTNPAYIEVGWELVLPANLIVRAVPTTATALEGRHESAPGTAADSRNSTTTDARAPEPAGGRTDSIDGHADSTGGHVVRDGETLWGIAEQHLGDGTDWPEIWGENAGRQMDDGRTFDDPNLILPGWTIDLPSIGASGGDDYDEVDTTLDEDAPGGDAPEAAGGDRPDDAARDVPDEIPDDESATVGADMPDDNTGGAPAADSGHIGLPGTSAPTVSTTPGDSATEPSNSATEPSSPSTGINSAPSTNDSTPSTSTTLVPAGRGADDDATRNPSGPAPEAPSPIRIEHAALLAAGVLALVGVRRRQRLRRALPRSRVPEPPAAVMATERRLRTLDASERSTRVDVALRAAAHSLVHTEAQVGYLTVGSDGDIEIRLTSPADLPAPWTCVAESAGSAWQLDASIPIELLSDDARRVGAPCVALVQLGVSDGRDVLIDLEACGTLAVEAHPVHADGVVTAVAAALASSPYAEIAHLISVSLPRAALIDHRNSCQAASTHDAMELAASLTGSTLLNERTTFALRSLRTGGEVWEPAVVLLARDDLARDEPTDRLLPHPGHGLVLVGAVGPEQWTSAPARLVARADGWTLHAFATTITLNPVGLSPSDLDELVAVIDDASAPLLLDDPNTDSAATAGSDGERATGTHHTPTRRGETDTLPLDGVDGDGVDGNRVDGDRADSADAGFEPMDHEVIVRLMGATDVISKHGDVGVFERSKTVELIGWLATHRDNSTRTAARTALWELDVRDATFANVVSEARRALGRLVEPGVHEEWLARTLTEQLPLHPAVVSDAQLIEERLTAAQLQSPAHAIRTLRPAAEMIRDMPFAGTSYLWPDAEGITSNLVLLAMSVTSELAAHALSLGDTDLVFWATGRGLKVLPGHEGLIGLRMRAHARAGNLAGVRQEWESYERVIVADAWSDGEPAPTLLALRRELLTSPS